MNKRRGFTFIELMMVIVIVMMLSAVALPRLGGMFGTNDLKAGARNVTGILRYARNLAVLREMPCEVRFSPDTDQYQLVLLDEQGEKVREHQSYRDRKKNDLKALDVGVEYQEPQLLPRRVHFSAIYSSAALTDDTRLPRIIYYPDGSATATTIALQDDKKRALSVEVFKTTGMARVQQGLPAEKPRTQTLYYGKNNKKLIREVD